MISFVINGNKIDTEKTGKLMSFLRDELHLTSVKNGCAEGACGACMIIIDGKPVKACCQMIEKMAGKTILTLEGFSAYEKSVYAWAFATSGAVQCGFCIPGMVISAKALIDSIKKEVLGDTLSVADLSEYEREKLIPTEKQVKNAIKNNICRCTGYKKIEQAILKAAKAFAFAEKVPCVDFSVPGFSEKEYDFKSDKICGENFTGKVGENLPRVDATSKVLGVAKYCDDLLFDGMIYGSAVRSKYARARILSIDTSEAKKLDGVVGVYTWEDLPAAKITGHLKQDWDVLIQVGCETHYAGDAIVLVAAKDKTTLEKAKELVKIEYEELEPIHNPYDAMKEGSPLIHETGNLLAREHLVRGNADEKIANAAYVVTNHYSTPFTEHAFLEPETAVAVPKLVENSNEVDSLTIYSGDQGIYQTKKECTKIVGLADDKVTVIAQLVGGGFGGKEDMSVQHHASVLAVLTKKPIKVSLSRKESILVHPKRHAMEIDMTTACDKDGNLLAMKAKIVSDTGAYASLGGPVLQRACTHAAGPYNYQDIDIVGEAWYTNNPPSGAFRGFGVSQSCFAIEQNINLLAEKCGLTPWEIRFKNAIRSRQVLPNGQIADDSTALVETLEAVKPYFDSHPKSGIACAMKNSGLGVGIPDTGRCRLVVKDGKVHIHSSAACIGQGMGTVTVQVVCDTTNLTPNFIVYELPNTSLAPDSGNTTASRQTLFTGEATHRAAQELLKAMECLGYNAEKDFADYKKIRGILNSLDGKDFYGEYLGVTDKMGCDKENPVSHIAYGYATHLIDIDDDGKLRKAIAAHDSGRIVNPISIEGQIQGGVTMGLGYALTEDFPLVNCIPTAKFGTLGLFRSTQVPEIEIFLCGKGENGKAIFASDKSENSLAYGAKGIGEIASIPTAPAVAHAYYNKDGVLRRKLPLENTFYSRKK